jgi:hypothetical protein
VSTATCRQFCTMECVFYGVPFMMLPGVLFFRCDVCMWSRSDDRSKGIDYKLARSMKVENILRSI